LLGGKSSATDGHGVCAVFLIWLLISRFIKTRIGAGIHKKVGRMGNP
jgi:hypothetical protein